MIQDLILKKFPNEIINIIYSYLKHDTAYLIEKVINEQKESKKFSLRYLKYHGSSRIDYNHLIIKYSFNKFYFCIFLFFLNIWCKNRDKLRTLRDKIYKTDLDNYYSNETLDKVNNLYQRLIDNEDINFENYDTI